MATTVTHADFDKPALNLEGPTLPFRRKVTASAFGTAINDVIKLGRAKRGMVIQDAMVQISDMDTGGPTLVFDLQITNGTTTKTIISGSTVGGTGGVARPSLAPSVEDGIGYVVPANGYWFQLKATAAATTPVANGVILVRVDHDWYRESGDITE